MYQQDCLVGVMSSHVQHAPPAAPRRDDVVRVLSEVFASVSRPSAKGGFVRDALVSG
jgi:hypothetical protein